MTHSFDRRSFLQRSAAATAGAAAAAVSTQVAWAAPRLRRGEPLFRISLAEWSLHHALFHKDVQNLDFPLIAKREYGIGACEYVNQFFMDKADDAKYLAELNRRAAGEGVQNVLIMIDKEGALGDPDPKMRNEAVQKHHKWVEAAKTLGCHSIRVNAYSTGSYDEQMKLVAEGLRRLVEYGAKHDINVIVENHGGLSSNGAWLTGVMRLVDHPRCGTLPDFGNFKEYDRYKAVAEMMPYAKGVSAKTHDFDDRGNCVETDYLRMMKIVLDAGYHGRVGIEYEGTHMSEPEGIRATKRLLERVASELGGTT
ncbi:MAG TPA: sugar phosphate isomerase/epimerase family protein [Planctomycetaceae bacterium]|jgi:sugar phosphate isomerase/epimerase|nr:sugar phosphate isomerase/epimerase family protein [Planctomycetaceae bacterium]